MSYGSSTSLEELTNGSFNLNVSTAKIETLTPGLPVKSSSDKELVSGLIDIDEVSFTPITNPLLDTLVCQDVETDDYLSVNQELQKIDNFNASAPSVTSINGSVECDQLLTDTLTDPTASSAISLTDDTIDIQSSNVLINGQPIQTDTTLSATELIVNPTTGDDLTGARGDSNKPYATLSAAYTAALDGDTIICHAGDLGSSPFTMTKVVDIRAYGSGFSKTQHTYVSGVTFNYAAANPSKGVRISGILFKGPTTFIGGNLSGTTRFDHCSFQSVTFNAGSYAGGHYFAGCFMDGAFTLRDAFCVFTDCSGSSAHAFVVRSGVLVVESWISTMGPLLHTGGIASISNVQSWGPDASGRAIFSGVSNGTPDTQGIVLRDCFLINGATPIPIEVAGSVSIFLTIYKCQITEANMILTGPYTSPNVQTVTTGPMTQPVLRMEDTSDPLVVPDGILSLYSKNDSLYTKNSAGDVVKLSTQPEAGYTTNRIMKSDAAGTLSVSQMSCVEDKNNAENWRLESTNPAITLANSAAGSSQYSISSGGVTSAVQGSATDMRLSHAGGNQLTISPTEVKLGNQLNANSNPLINVSRVNINSSNVAVGSTTADLTINTGTTAIGAQALDAYTSNVIGSNSALGYQAGKAFDGAGECTFLGHLSGNGHLTGSTCTYVGAQSTDTLTNASNQTVIGSGAQGNASNQVVLGNTSVTQVINSGASTCDLGAPSHEFKDLYMSGTANVGGIDVGTGSVVNMADPTNPQDAATKAYVDAQTGGSSSKTQNISATQTTPGVTKINDVTSTNSLYLRDEGLSTWDPASGVGAAGTPIFDRSVLTCQSSANGVKFIPATDAFTFGDALTWEFNISGAVTADDLYLGFVGNATPNNGVVNFCGLKADGTIYNNGSSVGGSGAAVWKNGGTIKFLIQGNVWSTVVNGTPIAPSYTIPNSLNFRPCLITDVADPAITTYECTIYDNDTVVAEVLGVLEMGGEIEMGGYRISNLGVPFNATDAATRDYVDNAVAQPTSKTQNIDIAETVPGTTQINGVVTTANIQAIGVPTQSITLDGSTLAINNAGATAQISDIGLVDITTPASIIMNAASIIDLDLSTATPARIQLDGSAGAINMTTDTGKLIINSTGPLMANDDSTSSIGITQSTLDVDLKIPNAFLKLDRSTGIIVANGTGFSTANTGPVTIYGGGDGFDIENGRLRTNIPIYIGDRPVVSSGFVLTGSATAANSTAEIVIIGPGSVGVGSLTAAANSAKVGSATRLVFSGSFDNANTSSTCTVRIKLGTQTINTLLLDADAVNANSPWKIEADYTVTAIGATGNIKSNVMFTYIDDDVMKGLGNNVAAQAINTTVAQDLSITAQWNLVSTSNTITVDQFVSTQVYNPQ